MQFHFLNKPSRQLTFSGWGFLVVALFATIWNPPAAGKTDQDLWFEALASINTYTPVEPAGSRGPLGTSLGFGLARTLTPPAPALQTEQVDGPFNNRAGSNDITAKRIVVTKGLMAPMDIGVVAGPLGAAGAMQAGAHIQATLFEGFRLPAGAIRFHSMVVGGIPETNFHSVGGELIGSWSILGWATPWLSAGVIHHRARLQSDAFSAGGYLLDDTKESKIWQRNWTELSPAAGLSLRLWSPFATVALESRRSGDLRSTVIKFSLGL
jgi:hypothetical protein